MSKDFDRWNDKKKTIDRKSGRVLFHEREIWWCALGVNVGSEQDGVSDNNFERPVLIVRNFNGLVSWALPLTRTVKPNRLYYRLSDPPEDSAVVLSQLRLISSKRLIRKIRTLDERQFRQVIEMLRRFLPE